MADTPLWMPFNVADYIKDTRHLTAAERGAYVELICYLWTNDGALANDPKRVFRLTGLSPREWALSRATLLEFFTLVDGVYRHKRVDQEIERARIFIEQKRAAGKASGKARSERTFNGRSTGVSTGSERGCNQLQSQSSVSKDTGGPAADPVKSLFDAGVFLLIGSGSTERAARSFIADARKKVGDERLAALLAEAKSKTEPRAWLAAAIKTPANDPLGSLSAAVAAQAQRKAAAEAA